METFRKTLRYVLFTHDYLLVFSSRSGLIWNSNYVIYVLVGVQFQISPDLEPEPCDLCFGWCSVPDQP